MLLLDVVTERGLARRGSRVWRLPVGMLAGVASTVAVYGAIDLWAMNTTAASGSFREAVEITLVVLFWAGASTGSGALSGWVAGRLEVLVATGSGFAGLFVLGYMPNSFADSVVLLFSAIPFLIFTSVGGMLTFFARRTDLR